MDDQMRGPMRKGPVPRGLYETPRQEMLDYLPRSNNVGRVLDVGCSSGAFGSALRDRLTSSHVIYGLEPDPDTAKRASDRGCYDRVINCRLEDLVDLDMDPFDVIFMNDVLEHIVDSEATLEQLRSLVAQDGVVIFSIPNVRHLSVIGPLVASGKFEYRESGLLDSTHVRFFTYSSIVSLLGRCGWSITHIDGINLGLYAGDRGARRWLRFVARLAPRTIQGICAVQYAVVATPSFGSSSRNARRTQSQ